MSSDTRRIPSSSQTVGPYFLIGLEYLINRMTAVTPSAESIIEIHGTVLDRDGVPVPDAMLEFWSPAKVNATSVESQQNGIPETFRRVTTDLQGSFSASIARPAVTRLEDERLQAPHAMVLVYARGLQRHLLTRVYLQDEAAHETDLVMLSIPPERRQTLTAKPEGANVYRWDVVLQGTNETVFFAW